MVDNLRTEPRERLGETYRRQESHLGAPYPTGAVSAMGRAASFATDTVKMRWASIFDDEQPVQAQDWGEVVGEREIPWEPGMTQARADFLISEYDYERYASQFEGRPIAEFVGMMGPMLFDPVSVATMPIGGANFTAATRAATLREFMGQSVAGGAKVGAASAPIEVAVQSQAYGEIRGDELAASVLGPLVASPLLLAPLRVLRGLGSDGPTGQPSADVPTAASAANQSDFPMDIERIIGPYSQESGISLAPPVRQIDASSPVPMARVDETFGGWNGGVRDWWQRFARGDQDAVEFARARGFDPESDALRTLIREETRLSARRMRPDEGRFQDLRDMMDAAEGRATPAQMQRLQQRGMAEKVPRLREVAEELADVPDQVRGIAERQTQAGRELRALRSELDELSLRPEFREMAESLRKAGFQRTHVERVLHKQFLQSGAKGLQDRLMREGEREYAGINTRLIALREELAARKGRKPKRLQDEVAQLEAKRSEIQARLESLRNTAGDVDDQVPMEQLLDALDAARLEAPVTTPPLRSATVGEVEATMSRPDPEVEQIESWMRSVGQDPAEARNLIARVEQAMAECKI